MIQISDLTEDQKNAMKNIINWYKNIDRQVFILNGSAGTGKTTLLKILTDELDITENTMFASFTGKASLVLKTKGIKNSSTIHRLIYNPIVKADGSLEFRLKDINELNSVKLIIIDESSMVSKQLLEDLLSFNIKIIFVGDKNQIPPIFEKKSLFDKPNMTLNQITRQAKDNPIIYLSQRIIKNLPLKVGKYGSKVRIVKNIKNESVLMEADQILVGTNAKRNNLNHHVRELNGITSIQPVMGDKIICKKNNWNKYIVKDEMFLLNGLIGKIFSEPIEREVNYFDSTINRTKFDVAYQFDFKINDYEYCIFDKLLASYDHLLNGTNEFKAIFNNGVDMFNFGYAITIHACLHEDTYIYTNLGLKQIKDLNNGANEKQFKKLTTDVSVYNGINMEKPLAFYNNGMGDGFKIKTKINGSVKCSFNHKWKVIDNFGYIVEKEAKNLTTNDFLLINKKNNIYGNITDLNSNLISKIEGDVRMIKYKHPNKLNVELSQLIGMIVADGTLNNSGVTLLKRHLDVVIHFSKLINDIFGYTSKIKKCSNKNAHITSINSNFIFKFFNRIDGVKPHVKFVPDLILSSTKECQQSFLSGLFEDGTVNLKKGKFDHIELTMKGNKIIDQVRMMLLNMGIVTTKKHYKDSLYTLYIYSKYAYKFYQEIGFISKFKNDRLKLVENITFENESDTYPNIPIIINKLTTKYNIKCLPWLQQIIRRNRITESKLLKFIFENENILKLDEDFKYLKYVIEYLKPDKIINIANIKLKTYSIEMPKTHNFVQNGYLGKNSQGSEFNKVLMYGDSLFGDEELRKRLLYTGITRSKNFLDLVI